MHARTMTPSCIMEIRGVFITDRSDEPCCTTRDAFVGCREEDHTSSIASSAAALLRPHLPSTIHSRNPCPHRIFLSLHNIPFRTNLLNSPIRPRCCVDFNSGFISLIPLKWPRPPSPRRRPPTRPHPRRRPRSRSSRSDPGGKSAGPATWSSSRARRCCWTRGSTLGSEAWTRCRFSISSRTWRPSTFCSSHIFILTTWLACLISCKRQSSREECL